MKFRALTAWRAPAAVRLVDLPLWFSTRQVCAQEGEVVRPPPTWRYRVLKTALRLRPRRALSSAPGQSFELTAWVRTAQTERSVSCMGFKFSG